MNPELFLLLRTLRYSLAVISLIGFRRYAGLGAVMLLFTGCVVAPRHGHAVVAVKTSPTVVVAEPPRTTERVVVVTEAPPPIRYEVVAERERPSAAHVWVRGHWRHDGRAYVWVPGHWERPPRVAAVWVEPRWEHRGAGYVFIEGVWR